MEAATSGRSDRVCSEAQSPDAIHNLVEPQRGRWEDDTGDQPGRGAGTEREPLRVLLVDIDFQGTLSRALVERALIGVQVGNGNLVNLLLTTTEASPAWRAAWPFP